MKNKNAIIKSLVWTCLLFFSNSAFAKLNQTYSQLAIRDLDEMNDMVAAKVAESKAIDEEESTEAKARPLLEAVKLILTRPDPRSENMVEKLLPMARNPLEDLQAWESSVTSIVDEALGALKDPKNINKKDQVSYTVILENLMAEIKPDAMKADGFDRKILVKISEANIKVTKECIDERKLAMMSDTASPSERAKKILAEIEKKEKPKK